MVGFPSVPFAPGIPPVPRLTGADAFSAPILLTEDAVSLFTGSTGPQWGLFLDGSAVVTAESIVGFEFRQDYRIADYPIEQGAFTSYDKVQTPFDVRLRFSSGGTAAGRQALLDSIAAIIGDTNLYDAVTPDQTYQNLNLIHYDYRRTDGRAGLIIIDVWCRQIMQASAQSFQNTAQPSGANPVNGGTVQPAAPTQQQGSFVAFIPGS
jgi:hypothetical protein